VARTKTQNTIFAVFVKVSFLATPVQRTLSHASSDVYNATHTYRENKPSKNYIQSVTCDVTTQT